MNMEAILWLVLPLLVAGGSSLLSFYIMQARMEVAIAKERESLAEARAIINTHKSTMEERIKATEEATRRAALDELMQEFRLEERSYMRENKQLARRTMVMQERVFFRNIPLSAWSEHEMLIEDGGASSSPDALPHAAMALVPSLPASESRLPISKRIQDNRHGTENRQEPMPKPVAMPSREPREPRESRTLVPAAAFGAQ